MKRIFGNGMNDEALGLRVLRILIDRGCEPGADYSDELAQTWFAASDLDDEQTELGFVVARDKGWVIMPTDRPGSFRISQAGFDAANAV